MKVEIVFKKMTVRRSMNYNNVRKGTVIEPTKRKKIRTVTLAEILKATKKQQELLGHSDLSMTMNTRFKGVQAKCSNAFRKYSNLEPFPCKIRLREIILIRI